MTITSSVQRQFYRSPSPNSDALIRIPPTVVMSHNLPRQSRRGLIIKTKRRLNIWTVEEHERFLLGLERFPKGPWKAIAGVVGTKTTRQTMTHSQKYREKIKRLAARAELALSDSDESSVQSEVEGDCAATSSDADDTAFWNGAVDNLCDSFNWDSDLDALFKELEGLPVNNIIDV